MNKGDFTLRFISSQNTEVLRLGQFLLESSNSEFLSTRIYLSHTSSVLVELFAAILPNLPSANGLLLTVPGAMVAALFLVSSPAAITAYSLPRSNLL